MNCLINRHTEFHLRVIVHQMVHNISWKRKEIHIKSIVVFINNNVCPLTNPLKSILFIESMKLNATISKENTAGHIIRCNICFSDGGAM